MFLFSPDRCFPPQVRPQDFRVRPRPPPHVRAGQVLPQHRPRLRPGGRLWSGRGDSVGHRVGEAIRRWGTRKWIRKKGFTYSIQEDQMSNVSKQNPRWWQPPLKLPPLHHFVIKIYVIQTIATGKETRISLQNTFSFNKNVVTGTFPLQTSYLTRNAFLQ